MAKVLIFLIFSAFGADSDPGDRDYHLKSVSGLQILNHYGSIEVQGWSLDKVRVGLRKKLGPTSVDLDSQVSVEVDQSQKQFEISTRVGKDLFLSEKIKSRKKNDFELDLIIRAPAHVPITVLGKKSKITIKNWNAPVEISAIEGEILVQDSASSTLRVLCPKCGIRAEAIKGGVKINGGDGSIELKKIQASDLYVETQSGPIVLEQVSGPLMLVSDLGEVRGKRLDGHVSFKTRSADLILTEIKGAIQGLTRSGNIHIEIKEWVSKEKQAVDSEEGSIHFSLPPSFSGEIEAATENGKLNLGFPLEKTHSKKIYGPDSMNRVTGIAGRGGELLSIQTKKGNIWLLQAL